MVDTITSVQVIVITTQLTLTTVQFIVNTAHEVMLIRGYCTGIFGILKDKAKVRGDFWHDFC